MRGLSRIFFFLTLILLPTQLGFHFWPDWAMVLGRRVDYLSPTIYLTDVLIITTLILWELSDAKKFLIDLISLINLNKRRNLKFLIFFLFVGLNIFLAQNRFIAVYKWIKVLEFTAFGYYIVKTKPNLSLITYCLSLGVFYSSLIAIIQFWLQHSIGGLLWWLGERTFNVNTPGIARIPFNLSFGIYHLAFGLRLRPYATFPHPNVLGGYIAAVMPLIIYQFSNSQILKSNKKRIEKTFLLTTIILGFIALTLTFSRSAWIAAMIGVGSMYYVLWGRGKKFVFSIILGAMPIIILFLVVLGIHSDDESVVVRQQLNVAAIKIWQQSHIFGVGLGNFLVKLPEVIPTRTIYFLQPVHNIYLLILSETGIIGLVIFFWLITLSLKNIFKKKFIIYNLSFIIILILGLVDHYPLTLQQGQLLLTILFSLVI